MSISPSPDKLFEIIYMLPPAPPPEPVVSLNAEIPGEPLASKLLLLRLIEPGVDSKIMPPPEPPKPPFLVPLPPPDPS